MVVRRTYQFWLVAYYLASCGWLDTNRISYPPKLLKVSDWGSAYDIFYMPLGGGRTASQFRNSLKNARDLFDAHIPWANRVGWRMAGHHTAPAPMTDLAQQVFSDCHGKSESELYERISVFIEQPGLTSVDSCTIENYEDMLQGTHNGHISSLRQYDGDRDIPALVIFNIYEGLVTLQSEILVMILPNGDILANTFSSDSKVVARYINSIKVRIGMDAGDYSEFEPKNDLHISESLERLSFVNHGSELPITAYPDLRMLYEKVFDKFDANLTQVRFLSNKGVQDLIRDVEGDQIIQAINTDDNETIDLQHIQDVSNIASLHALIDQLPEYAQQLSEELISNIPALSDISYWSRRDFKSEAREVFGLFAQRDITINLARNGITDSADVGFSKLTSPPTLKTLGDTFGITRERVRQIQSAIKKQLSKQKGKINRKIAFLELWLTETLNRRGKLVLDLNNIDDLIYQFISIQWGLPVWALDDIDAGIIGISPPHDCDGSEAILMHLRNLSDDVISESDTHYIEDLLKAHELANPPVYSKIYKTYLALKSLGIPAHFSEVYEEYCRLNPGDIISLQLVHNTLSACAQPDEERFGIVWVGAKGMYALSDWGYRRPPRPLFDTVAYVVRTRFEETGLPVDLQTIRQEVFKDHPLIQENSFIIAVTLNEALVKYGYDKYLPSNVSYSQSQEDIRSIMNFPWLILIYSKKDADDCNGNTVFAVALPNRHILMKKDDKDFIAYIGSFSAKWLSDDAGYRQWILSGSETFLMEHERIFGHTRLDVEVSDMPVEAFYWQLLRRYNNTTIGSTMVHFDEARTILAEGNWDIINEVPWLPKL